MVATTMENQSLVLDLVEWVARQPRSYDDVMDAWRTSCPRLAIWEDAVDNALVEHTRKPGRSAQVIVTRSGRAFLKNYGRLS